ncbi:hypothetical protein BD410DRAFT_289996 [Rickenella mellea]|uniref:DUF6533 domain-containing protein n=1 Tax=Rickenella mellea TaxID=50990 RepID=A0A4Y7Q2T3_9AGAM|nr:hypothetical protein BD410DRAFT_289996 [Rickenella mellea]
MNKERKYYRSQNPTLEITSITTLYPTAQLLRAQAYPSRNILLRVTPMESKSIGGISIVKATLVFTGTLLVYDYMITFKREVKLVWMQKWTRGKAMFMLNRYLPFPDTFLVLCLRMRQNSTSSFS